VRVCIMAAMSSSRRMVLGIGCAAAFGLLAPAARGSLVVAMDLPELTAAADRIVVGDVLSVESQWDKAKKKILSTIQIQVGESWKGDAAPGGSLTIVQPGGVVGDLEMRVHGLPSFTPGERAVLFLRGKTRAALVGFGQGKRPLFHDATAGRWMVGGGDVSAAVKVDARGRLEHVLPDRKQPLDEFRRQIRALVKR
jgi:hypothetical protein